MIEEVQQVVGRGELWCGAELMLSGVTYHLDCSADGNVRGQICAPPAQRLARLAASPDVPLLRLASGRFIAFEIRVYERRLGGSAQIAGHLLPATLAVTPVTSVAAAA